VPTATAFTSIDSIKEVTGGVDEEEPDMKNILGYLNQSEWITTLNIGNIMQITAIQAEDLTATRRNEQELTRDAFLETVTQSHTYFH